MYQDGDINDKAYQEALIDTFLVAAYLYDDEIKVVFNLGDKRQEHTLPVNIDDVSFSPPDVRISAPDLHQ